MNEFEQNLADGEVGSSAKHKPFAVSFFSLDTNKLVTEIHHAANWREAAIKHSDCLFCGDDGESNIDAVPGDVNDARVAAFDMDGGFDIVELTINEGGEIEGICFEHSESEYGDDDEPSDTPDDVVIDTDGNQF